MKNIIGIIAIFIIIVFIDIKGLLNSKKSNKTIIVYFTILILGFVISLLLTIDKAPPSPAIYIEKAIDKIVPNR